TDGVVREFKLGVTTLAAFPSARTGFARLQFSKDCNAVPLEVTRPLRPSWRPDSIPLAAKLRCAVPSLRHLNCSPGRRRAAWLFRASLGRRLLTCLPIPDGHVSPAIFLS